MTEIIHPKPPGHLGTWLYQHWTQTIRGLSTSTLGLLIVHIKWFSLVKHPRTVGLGQFNQEELLSHIEQPESTLLGEELLKKQVHRSSHRSTSRMDQTRNTQRAHLQQQQPAQRQVLHKADDKRNSRKKANIRGTPSLHRHRDTRRIFHTTLENSRNITNESLDSTVQEMTTSATYGIT